MGKFISLKKRHEGIDVPKLNKILTKELRFRVIRSQESNYDKARVVQTLYHLSLDGTIIQWRCYQLLNQKLLVELKDPTITDDLIIKIYLMSIKGSSAQKKAYKLLEERLTKKSEQAVTYEQKFEIHCLALAIPDSVIYKKNQESLEAVLIERLNNPELTRQQIEKLRSEACSQIHSTRVTQIADNLLAL